MLDMRSIHTLAKAFNYKQPLSSYEEKQSHASTKEF